MTRPILGKLIIYLSLTAIVAFAQTKPAFEVATIKPSAPLDAIKLATAMQSGGKLPVGATVDGHRAEYLYLDLKSLISLAYGVKPYQVSGPDWMATERFDIEAKLPDGAAKEDAPKMLQALLEDRFKLTSHRATAEHTVSALVVGKDGPKLKASTEKPVPIDEDTPLKPGEVKTDGPDGQIRIKIDMTTGSSVIDMGVKGKMAYRVDPATQSMHIDFSMTTLDGLADMMTQLFTQLAGGVGGRRIVNQTGITGNYDATVELSLAELLQLARASGVDIPVNLPNGAGGPGGNSPLSASDPGAGSSLTDAVRSMGLKLESRKAPVDQLV